MTNSLSISVSAGDPFIVVTGRGLWAPDHVEQHFRNLDRALRTMRGRMGFARVLVDLSESPVQTADAAAMMNLWTGRIYRATDEVAVISESMLLAMQIRRENRVYHRATFRDRNAAIAWLLSDKQAPPARSA